MKATTKMRPNDYFSLVDQFRAQRGRLKKASGVIITRMAFIGGAFAAINAILLVVLWVRGPEEPEYDFFFSPFPGELERAQAEWQQRLSQRWAGIVGPLLWLAAVWVAQRFILPRLVGPSARIIRFTGDELAPFLSNDQRLGKHREILQKLKRVLARKKRVDIWRLARPDIVTPSIVRLPSRFVIIIPDGWRLLAVRDKNAAHAMVAHEFGHVYQNDINLWDLSYIITTKLWIFGAWAAVCQIAIAFTFQLFAVGAMNWTMVGWGTFWSIRLRRDAVLARKQSELLADACATAFVGSAAMLSALSYLKEVPGSSALHPSIEERKASIQSGIFELAESAT